MTFVHRFDRATAPDPRTALVLHGTGGDENSLVPFAQTLMPGAAVLSPRGRILENGMPRFFRRFGEGVFDYDNIREEADALEVFLREATETYGFDPAFVTAIGYSNGANIAWSTLLRHPDAIAELVLFRPMVTLTDERPDLAGKRIFVGAGRQDMMVGESGTQALVYQMQLLGATVTLNWHPGGHELARPELETASLWLGLT